MSNKKVVFAILAFAIVAALLTMARTNHMEMMGEAPMGGVTPMRGKGTNSFVAAPKPSLMAMPSGGGTDIYYQTEMDAPQIMQQRVYSTDFAINEEDRSVDKNSYHGVVVANVPEYIKELKSYLQSVGAKVVSSNQNTMEDMQYASLTVKVPVEKFDEVTGMVASKAKKVMNESINATDVTAQRVGLEDRSKALQEEKTKKEAEVTAAKTAVEKKRAQQELDMINQQIKYAEKAQASFTERLSFATVSITAADSEEFFNPHGGVGWHGEAKQAFKSLGATGSAIAYFLIWVVVYAIIWLPLVLLARWMWNKMRPASTSKK